MTRNSREARTRARTRRLELDRDRAVRDRKVEAAAAQVFVLLEQREQVRRAAGAVDRQIGQVLLSLVADGLTVQEAAAYCDLPRADGRRLIRLAGPGDSAAAPGTTPAAVTAATSQSTGLVRAAHAPAVDQDQ